MKKIFKKNQSLFLKRKATEIRIETLKMIGDKGSHIGTAFSCIDILTVLYFKVLNINPKNAQDKNRDRFVLSKGHAYTGLYVTLAKKGFIKKNLLKTYLQNGSMLHMSSVGIAGCDYFSGSLGHGFNIAVGLAIAAKNDHKKYKIYVIISDGECDEGSTWEAALSAAHHKLNNLIVILDYNKIQAIDRVENVVNLEPLADKWKSFGFSVCEVNGHNHNEILNSLKNIPFEKNKPSIIIAHTVKGKGVSFMENSIEWHYLTPDKQILIKSFKELKKQL